MSVPMMAITTSSSTSVKPGREGGSEQRHRRQFEAGAWEGVIVMVAAGVGKILCRCNGIADARYGRLHSICKCRKRNSAVIDRKRRRAEVWITTWEALVRRAEVGIWIRDGRVDEALILASSRRRDRIEALEHAVMDADHPDEGIVSAALKQLQAAALVHRDAVRGSGG